MDLTLTLLVFLLILAFLCELVDTSIGGGYGTILTPLGMSIGINPLYMIPAILFSEICTGFLGGYAHYRFKNVNFGIVALDGVLGFFGIALGVLLGISIPPIILKMWIGLIVLACGVFLLLSLKGHYVVKGDFKLRNDIPLTLACSFNKGMSGGGYGPLSTSGLIIVKAPPKKAVGSTILSEGIVCSMGFLMFMLVGRASIYLNPLTISLTTGACLATFPGAYITKRMNPDKLKLVVGLFVTCLGVWTLSKVVF